MHKIFRSFLLLIVLGLSIAQAQVRLKTADTAEVEAGFIKDTVILVDSAGELFLEFLKGDRVAKTLDKQIYDGEILPPVPIDVPDKAPRARMRHVLSFEVISDTNEPLDLIDQYAAIHAKKRLRLSLASTTDQRRQGAQLITMMNQDEDPVTINRPALWRYHADKPEDPWQRLGGLMGDTSEGDTKVFSAFLYATGVYTIWDENPGPDFQVVFPIDEIEFADPSPFPSVTDEALLDDSQFVEELLGTEALLETELNPEPSGEAVLIPAVEGEANTDQVAPATTSQIPAVPTEPSISNLQALPSGNANPLGTLIELPPVEDPSVEDQLDAELEALLNDDLFVDFGVEEGDLPEAGFGFPWALLLVLGVIGFSVYSVRQKPY